MHRETATAIWYRRLDPGCFTNQRHMNDGDSRPAMEASHGPIAPAETPVYATDISDHWPSLAEDEHGRPAKAVAHRR